MRLFAARGSELGAVCEAADEVRSRVNGDVVTYVVNRNINYTNVCYFRCQFCAFSKGKMSESLRGKPYNLGLDEVIRRSAEAWDRGATEVCMQGGIHPEYTGQTYIEICRAVREAVPGMHVHAFSPLEVWQGAATLGVSLEVFLESLQDAGLGTLPGTAAEILDDEIRDVLCPDKLNTEQWLEVMETAHRVGFRTTATIMYGHMESSVNWARHLLRLRALQERTGGFTEFVPLPFVHMEAPIYLKGHARRGPTFREAVLMHAVARLALQPALQQYPDLVGKDGQPRSEGLPERRSERSRRHAHERVDHSGRRRRTWSGAGPRPDGRAHSQLWPHPQTTQHGLWRGTGRTHQAVVRGARAHTPHQPGRLGLRAGRIRRRETR